MTDQTEETTQETTSRAEEIAQAGAAAGEAAEIIANAAQDVIKRITERPVESFQGLSEEDAQIIKAQQGELVGLIENALRALVVADQQFSRIADQIEGWMAAHNNLTKKLNESIFNPEWLVRAVEGVVANIERTKELNEQTLAIRSRINLVELNESTDVELEVGQYISYIVYPDNPSDYDLEDLDKNSYNVVKVKTPTGIQIVNRKEAPAVFAAISLALTEHFTDAVNKGIVAPEPIMTRDNQEYLLLKHSGVFEIISTPASDAEAELNLS